MEIFSLGQCFTRITEDQSELQQEMLFWVCPQPSTFLLIFSAHRMILSWLGCSIPPGQKPLVPKSWSAPITSNSFFLLHYVVHTCGLLISCLQIPTHRAGRYYRECVSMAHLASSSYPQSISPWTSHTETHLTAFIHRVTHYHNQLPLILGDIISAAGASSVQKDTMTLSGRWILSKRSSPSSAAVQREWCPCRSHLWTSLLSSSSSVTFSLEEQICSLNAESSLNYTYWRPAPSHVLHSLQKMENPSLRHQIFTCIWCLTVC